MSNCPNCGDFGVRNGEYCDCVHGVEKRLKDSDFVEFVRSAYRDFLVTGEGVLWTGLQYPAVNGRPCNLATPSDENYSRMRQKAGIWNKKLL